MAKKTIVTPEMDGVGYIDGGSVNDEILDMWHQLRKETGVDSHKSIEAPFHELDRKHGAAILWTATMIEDLGQLTDLAFATKYSMDRWTVRQKRKSLEIDNCRKIVWTEAMCGLLGTMNDLEFSKQYGMSQNTAQLKRKELGIPPFGRPVWTQEMIDELGTMLDKDFAVKHNTSRSSVMAKRHELCVKAFRKRQTQRTQ